ncbi:MAG TPA: hypothetical protein VMS53_01905 [Burkholderiales bacterium]|nr:hypothetical protein [Burkholderiales bacterium]
MDDKGLSDREKALLAEARRELAAHKAPPPAAAPARSPAPAAPEAKAAPSLAERLEKLMAEERAEAQEKKKKMRRYGLAIAGGILGAFALWVLRVSRRR